MANHGKISNMKIEELLEYGKNNLIEKEEPIMLSKILLKHLLNVDNSYLLINKDKEIEEKITKKFKAGILSLKQGMPIQYITNTQEFMGLNFYVDENVLIPQPDTEILVEEIIETCKEKQQNYQILDLCTGSGAIGISLAKIIPNSMITMSDISEKALKIAQRNAKANEVIKRCKFIQSDLFEKIEEKFDVIVSNPPYIQTKVIPTLSKEVQHEPKLALDGGTDGLDFYRKIAQNAHLYLSPDGILALEIGYDQKEEVIKLLKETSEYENIYCKKDLAGNNRVIVCKK